MEFVDFGTGTRGSDIGILFPGWTKGEAVAFLSPHDDDAVLGAGYLLRAVKKAGGKPFVVIFCKGDAGYSKASEKKTIVARRKREACAAYGALGVPPEDIIRFERPDLSLMGHVNRISPAGRKGVVEDLIRVLRSRRTARVVFTGPHYENWDHTAVYMLGMYAAPQAGDPILADLGRPSPTASMLVYSVWGDLAPRTDGAGVRADLGVLAGDRDEQAVRKALGAFASQADIMANAVASRRDARRGPDGWLELYARAAVREPINYMAYFRELGKS
jgi:LmbE family N-acetylglucosaminyl deacetylase